MRNKSIFKEYKQKKKMLDEFSTLEKVVLTDTYVLLQLHLSRQEAGHMAGVVVKLVKAKCHQRSGQPNQE